MNETTVYRTWDESMAEMAVDLLRLEGIEARKVDSFLRSIYPFTLDGLGEIAVVVPEEDIQEALDILAVRFSEAEPDEFGDGESGEEYNDDRSRRSRYHDDEDRGSDGDDV